MLNAEKKRRLRSVDPNINHFASQSDIHFLVIFVITFFVAM